jgi:hypothetical protein
MALFEHLRTKVKLASSETLQTFLAGAFCSASLSDEDSSSDVSRSLSESSSLVFDSMLLSLSDFFLTTISLSSSSSLCWLSVEE